MCQKTSKLVARQTLADQVAVELGHRRWNRGSSSGVQPRMDDDEREAIRAEGLNPDDATVQAALDLVRLGTGTAPPSAIEPLWVSSFQGQLGYVSMAVEVNSRAPSGLMPFSSTSFWFTNCGE
jgi:hypothetical protein